MPIDHSTFRRPKRTAHAIVTPCGVLAVVLHLALSAAAAEPEPARPEVRGAWITTSGNDALATPAKTTPTMEQLGAVGFNTVYVEAWRKGYTQFPSKVLERTLGVERRPALVGQGASDNPSTVAEPGSDLFGDMLVEAHRNRVQFIAWFVDGFVAADKSAPNHLWNQRKDWLSRDINGNEIAPDGKVWMNPLHPEARRFLLDLALEAVARYDIDGVQFDSGIGWPTSEMGYDDFTKRAFAAEHAGREPPSDPRDLSWLRWRANKVSEYARVITQELHAARPGLVLSLSANAYPWAYENQCVEWPRWASWTSEDKLPVPGNELATGVTPRWDEIVLCNRGGNGMTIEEAWLEQVAFARQAGDGRVRDLVAGVGTPDGEPDSAWERLRRSITAARSSGGGHIHQWPRGGGDRTTAELTAFYGVARAGNAANPHFGPDWRPAPIVLAKVDPGADLRAGDAAGGRWVSTPAPFHAMRVIVKRHGVWREEFAFCQQQERLRLSAGGGRHSGSFAMNEALRLGATDGLGGHGAIKLLAPKTALELAVWKDGERVLMQVTSVHDRARPDGPAGSALAAIEGVEMLIDRRGDARPGATR